MRVTCLLLLLFLAACSSLPVDLTPSVLERQRGPFVPRDELPVPPNVARLIGPHSAWTQGRQGWVVVRFDVLPDGQVDNVRIAHAVPDGPFNRASRRAVRAWQFRSLQGDDSLHNCVVLFEFRAGEVSLR